MIVEKVSSSDLVGMVMRNGSKQKLGSVQDTGRSSLGLDGQRILVLMVSKETGMTGCNLRCHLGKHLWECSDRRGSLSPSPIGALKGVQSLE